MSKQPQNSENVGESLTMHDEFKWGYDLYPERRRNRPVNFSNFFLGDLVQRKQRVYKCEKKVVSVLKESPLLRIMISALAKAGCPINFTRHFSCEWCQPMVTGGYDPIQNQIVICYNNAIFKNLIHNVLWHEMIHMFDNCVHKLDFKNIDHVACTEIRAANLTYCTYLAAFINGHIKRFSFKAQQKECVKKRAIDSVFAVRDVTIEEATAAVEKVFDKCYNDLEPIGRRIKKRSCDQDLAYSEAFLLGYD